MTRSPAPYMSRAMMDLGPGETARKSPSHFVNREDNREAFGPFCPLSVDTNWHVEDIAKQE